MFAGVLATPMKLAHSRPGSYLKKIPTQVFSFEILRTPTLTNICERLHSLLNHNLQSHAAPLIAGQLPLMHQLTTHNV